MLHSAAPARVFGAFRGFKRERALVGEVISTVALADQISRECNVSAVQTAEYAKYAEGGRG